MTNTKLRQGDYVYVKDLTNDQVQELVDKFVEAGAQDHDMGSFNQEEYPILQWDKVNDIWCSRVLLCPNRELSPEQVLASGATLTPCEKLGYKVGDRFKIVNGDCDIFEVGSIVELQKDDGSYTPLSKLISGRCLYQVILDEIGYYVPGGHMKLDNVEKLEEESRDQPQTHIEDSFIMTGIIDTGERPATDAPSILGAGVKHMADRAATYDTPGGERSMARAVAVFNALHDTHMTEEEGWQFMAILKMVRSIQGDFKLDNYEDWAAYAALAGEAAAKNRE